MKVIGEPNGQVGRVLGMQRVGKMWERVGRKLFVWKQKEKEIGPRVIGL